MESLSRKLNIKRAKAFNRRKKITLPYKSDMDIDVIKAVVCGYHSIPITHLDVETRKREIVWARQEAMYFSKMLSGKSLATIGEKIGDKDHATVLHAVKTVNNLIETDRDIRHEVYEIERLLKVG